MTPIASTEPETVGVTDLMAEVGISYRQLNYWVGKGWVEVADGIANPGTGYWRRFTRPDVFVAKVVKCLRAFGMDGHALARAIENIREHSPAARLVYIQSDGTTHWGPGDIAAIVIDLDQLRLKPTPSSADDQ